MPVSSPRDFVFTKPPTEYCIEIGVLILDKDIKSEIKTQILAGNKYKVMEMVIVENISNLAERLFGNQIKIGLSYHIKLILLIFFLALSGFITGKIVEQVHFQTILDELAIFVTAGFSNKLD